MLRPVLAFCHWHLLLIENALIRPQQILSLSAVSMQIDHLQFRRFIRLWLFPLHLHCQSRALWSLSWFEHFWWNPILNSYLRCSNTWSNITNDFEPLYSRATKCTEVVSTNWKLREDVFSLLEIFNGWVMFCFSLPIAFSDARTLDLSNSSLFRGLNTQVQREIETS